MTFDEAVAQMIALAKDAPLHDRVNAAERLLAVAASLDRPVDSAYEIVSSFTGRGLAWTVERVEVLNRLYAAGGIASVRRGMPECSESAIMNALGKLVTVESKDAWRIAKKSRRGAPIPTPTAPAARVASPAIVVSAPEVGRLVEPAAAPTATTAPKPNPAPYSPKPRPRVNPFRPVPKLRALAAEEKPLPIRSPRLEASDPRRACLACGATAFTLPIDPRDPQGPRECRSSSDCAKRQARGGVVAMKSAPLPGPRAGVASPGPRVGSRWIGFQT